MAEDHLDDHQIPNLEGLGSTPSSHTNRFRRSGLKGVVCAHCRTNLVPRPTGRATASYAVTSRFESCRHHHGPEEQRFEPLDCLSDAPG